MIKIKIDKSVWVIGDVHGQYDKLIELLDKIPKEDAICFVGDLIDKSRGSKKVVKLIREKNFLCVKGNHEQMSYSDYSFWIQEGGKLTINGYSDKYSADINYAEEYKTNKKLIEDIAWLKELPLIIKFELDNEKPLYVSHSGLKLNIDDDKIEEINDEDTILWNRRVQDEVDFAINIHGHSPRALDEIFTSKSQINVDTGAQMRSRPLTAIQYPSLKLIHAYD